MSATAMMLQALSGRITTTTSSMYVEILGPHTGRLGRTSPPSDLIATALYHKGATLHPSCVPVFECTTWTCLLFTSKRSFDGVVA